MLRGSILAFGLTKSHDTECIHNEDEVSIMMRPIQPWMFTAALFAAASPTVPAFAREAGVAVQADTAKKTGHIRRMIVRADDVGATEIYNKGVFEAIDNGVVTWADVMLDSPGTVDALRKLKARPWISVGWHAHMWGSPVLPAARVSSLIVPEGQPFAGRFRTDIQTASDVKYEEALAELRAQIQRCIQYLGRPPRFGSAGNGMPGQPVTPSPFVKAKQKVIREFGLIDGWYNAMGQIPALPQYAAKKVFYTDNITGVKDFYQTDSVVDWENNYSPANYYTEDRGGQIALMDEGWTPVRAFHPGYLDLWTYRYMERGDRTMARRFTITRLLDLEGLTSAKTKDWIKRNQIALVSPEDVLFDRNLYQQHLKKTNSQLYLKPSLDD